jgi:predicted Zn-dependent protease
MHLTADGLTLVSSAVAVVAIIGGYLGVRSANNTAVAIARDERAARRRSELDSQKRIAYSSFLAALSQLADDQIQLEIATRQKPTETDELWLRAANSARIANDNLANVSLVASESIRALANTAFSHALKASDSDITTLAEEGEELAGAMRNDLEAD